MNCKQIKEILITDYLDGELDETEKAGINQHLSHCQHCRQYLKSIMATTIKPFADSLRDVPSPRVWQKLEDRLDQKAKNGLFFNPLEIIHRLLDVPRSIFALSSALALLLIGMVLVQSPHFFKNIENRQLSSIYLEEGAAYFVSSGSVNGDTINLNTAIEDYLL